MYGGYMKDCVEIKGAKIHNLQNIMKKVESNFEFFRRPLRVGIANEKKNED